MLFNSLTFLVFFSITLIGYFLIPKKARYLWLLAASYYFYASWNVKYVLLLLSTTVISYVTALLLERFSERAKAKALTLTACLALNLGLLCYFKYFGFLVGTLQKVLTRFGTGAGISAPEILLPMGISFHLFQSMGYAVDVYRGTVKAEKNPLRFALFLSFFPQLVAGPIERADRLGPQLRNMDQIKVWDAKRIQKGALIMLYGYFMKMIIADRAAIIVDTVFDPVTYSNYTGFTVWVAAILFSIQIYCDFAGYTYIAIGAAKVMGFDLMQNFHAPYLSRSVKEFWDRWHISLSKWFRDYLYFPLGGSRKGKVRKYVNIMIVFLLSGLWHGAGWHFVFWGGMHGILRVLEEVCTPFYEKHLAKWFHDSFAARTVKRIVVFLFVTAAWVAFRASSIRQTFDLWKSMLKPFNPWVLVDRSLYGLGLDEKDFRVLVLAILFMILVDLAIHWKKSLSDAILAQPLWLRWLVLYVGIAAVLIFGIYGAEYNAAEFIYFQF